MLLVVAAVVLSVGCSQPYGRQICKQDKECETGQFCPAICTPADGGAPDPNSSAVCSKQCTTDADCGSLGLKKPACATNLCAGTKTCIDNPF